MHPPIAVTPAEWDLVLDILDRIVPDSSVWAFGSRASFTHKKFSDLDLAVQGDAALSLPTMAELREAFSNSDLPYRVDVVDWPSATDSFREVIGRKRVLVTASDGLGNL